MKRAIKLTTLAIVAIAVAAVLYGEAEKPNFERILAMSGLPFQMAPTPTRWIIENSGPFGSNQIAIVEFNVNEADAEEIEKCNAAGFQRGVPEGWELFLGMVAQPADLSRVCWRQFEHQGTYFFAVFDEVLVYRLVIL